jgi:hypothetical protein
MDLRDVLRRDVLESADLRAQLRRALLAGRPCVIRDAFAADYAERVYAALDSIKDWEPVERFRQPFSSFCSHSLVDRALFPAALNECEAMFAHAETRAAAAELSGLQCHGESIFNATLYLPADYLSPHNDVGGGRSVSFIWQLSKDWLPQWGGHLFWCSPPTNIAPTFNTLILYRVAAESYHAVLPVTPHARGKRFTISGWWTDPDEHASPAAPPAPWYRGPMRELAPGVLTIGSEP